MNPYENSEPFADRWQKRARALALKLNFNWWLTTFLPLVIGWSVAAALGLILVRQYGVDTFWLWTTYGGGLLVMAAIAAGLARSKMISTDQALVRLEYVHGLENRLSAARAGVADWPDPDAVSGGLDDFYRTRLERVGLPLGSSLVFLLLAALIPVTSQSASNNTPMQQPHAWQQLTDWAEELEESGVIDPESIENIEEQLDQLRARPSEEWYQHGSLEAGETLRNQTESAISELGQNLESVKELLNAMEMAEPGTLSPGQMEALSKELKVLTDQLQMGKLPLNKELLDQLRKIDPSTLKQMSQKQLEELKKQLSKASTACQSCSSGKKDGKAGKEGKGEGSGSSLSKEAREAVTMALQKVLGAGTGGVQRGPGTAPLFLNQNESDLGTNNTESVSNPDFKNPQIGDTIALSSDEHDVDKEAYQGSTAGGDASTGSGGEAVWRGNLTPDEEAVVEKFFE